MSQQQPKIKLFCADNTPLYAGNYIFDNTYRNINEKRRFQKDPKYAYFNAIVKMKNNYIKNKKDVYNHLFKTNDESLNESVNGYQNNYISKNIDIQQYQLQQSNFGYNNDLIKKQRSMSKRLTNATFHVEKINSHSFKIYKDKKNIKGSSNSISQELKQSSINNVKFQVHFRNKLRANEQKQKPKIQMLLKQYRKLQLMKSRVNPEKERETQFKNNSLYGKARTGKNWRQSKTSQTRKLSLNSINSLAKIIDNNGSQTKNKSNMSELALRICK